MTMTMTPDAGRDDGPNVSHEHTMQLVAVDYDDAGHAVREMQCPGCGETSFEN